MPGSGLGLLGGARPPRLAWLRSQGLGVLTAQGAVLLLALGSVVLTVTAGDASKAIAMDEIRGFFTTPSLAHLWFYLLLAVLTLFALNTALCTFDSVTTRWRAGIRAPAAYAASLIHVGVLVALFAHLVGGVWNREDGQMVVAGDWRAFGDGRLVRLKELQVVPQADGSPKTVRAFLELRAPMGDVTTEVVGFNEPLSAGLGRDLTMLVRPMRVPRTSDRANDDAVLLRRRHAPGNSVGLFAAVAMALGVLMMWRRLV
ncbi:MAG: hypothetical protein HY903_17655 [Deltaproteobacteria bacterium]|nr:hypothetical protein [Deltaproteobacteria bacterium]